MKTSYVVAGIVIVLLAGGIFFVTTRSTDQQPVATTDHTPVASTPEPPTPITTTTTTISTTSTRTTQPSAPAPTSPVLTTHHTIVVSYGRSGFSPKNLTVSTGDTVTFVAAPGSDEMWIASNPHPTHQGYDGTTKDQHCAAGYTGPKPFDQCTSGTSFGFTFQKNGTWGYHNHGNPGDSGTVIVK